MASANDHYTLRMYIYASHENEQMRIVSLIISLLLSISTIQAQTDLSLICPDDITIGCEILVTPENTGMPIVIGYDNSFFIDSVIQNCPGDIILERSWVAQLGTTISDTCVQIITVNFDSVAPLTIADTIRLPNACVDELPSLLQESFGITCDISIASVDFVIQENTCDLLMLSADWVFNVGCADTTFTADQVVIVDNPTVGRFTDPVVTVDSATMLGSIDLSQLCPGPSLNFIWSNGETTLDLNNVPAGTYELVYANDLGCSESLTVEVPAIFVSDTMTMDTMMMDTMTMDTMMMDTMMMDTTSGFVLICPPDTIVSCNSGLDPSLLGMASIIGFDSVRFVDIVIDSCPSDLIIDRQWIASGSEMLDTCIQQISVQRNGLDLIGMSDSTTFNGICINDLLDESTFDLACGLIIDTIMLELDSVTCGSANLSRSIVYTDECLDSTIVVTQNVTINELPVARLIGQNITGDNGEGNGMIDLTFASCSDSISFQWSNGATTEDLPRVIQGSYTLVVSNQLGCTDTLEFFVPSQNPEAFLLQVRDRDNELIDVNNISVRRSSGGDITTNIIRLDVGQYQMAATTQTIIRGDQLCMEINEPAANDLSVLDVIRGQRHILGIENACEEDLIAGDVNFSGGVTGSDLASMQRIILGLSDEYPDSLSWTFVTDGFTPVSVRQEGCIEIESDFFEDRIIEVQAIKLGDYRCER